MLSKEQFYERVFFCDVISEKCYDFVHRKQLAGIQCGKQILILQRFLNFCNTNGFPTSFLSKEAVEAWSERDPNESHQNQYIRASAVRRLAEYIASTGTDAYISESVRYKKSDFTPYILSIDELRRIFSASDAVPFCCHAPQRHIVIPLLFRMLYGCGLRLSEALSLNVGDVDLEAGILTIRETKFHKDRLVPMDFSLTRRCVLYSQEVLYRAKPDDAFFPGPDGVSYAPGTMYYAWRQLLVIAGISHGGKGKGPRIHDLRHTFAVRCLQKWIIEGVDLTVALPYLSAYMGHVGLSSTQEYLRLLPEMYPEVIRALEAKFDVVPDLEVVF